MSLTLSRLGALRPKAKLNNRTRKGFRKCGQNEDPLRRGGARESVRCALAEFQLTHQPEPKGSNLSTRLYGIPLYQGGAAKKRHKAKKRPDIPNYKVESEARDLLEDASSEAQDAT